MQSNITVMGLYNYDPTIFANMEFPTGFTVNDADDLIDSIILETAELEVLYNSPSFMKSIIGLWSRRELPTWNRVYAAAQAEYNPIENYDRQETSSDTTTASRQHSGTDTTTNTGTDTTTNTGTDTVTNSGTDTTTNSGTDTVTNSGKDTTQLSGTDTSSTTLDNDVSRGGTDRTAYSGSDVVTNRVAGFDSNTLVNKEDSTTAYGKIEAITHGETIATDETVTGSLTHGQKTELTHGHVEATQHGLSQSLLHGHVEATQHGHTQALQHGHTQALQHGEKIEDSTTVSHTSRIKGNIGVTTSQQMLEQELEVAPKLNIINYIVDSFKKRFCLLVY